MPQLIRTPEDIFRAEGKDVYVVQFFKDEISAEDELTKWLRTHLPDTATEPLGYSEHSGVLMGGAMGLRVDFSADGLARYCERWETPEGKSTDERFQCYLIPYQAWHEKHGRFVPTRDQPSETGYTCWLDSPIGFIYHQLSPSEESEGNDSGHPASAADLLWQAKRLWPELEPIQKSRLTYGEIRRFSSDDPWYVTYSEGFPTNCSFLESRKEAMLNFFRLPLETQILSDW